MKDIILFVDDDINLLHSYERQFKKLYNIETANSGLDAIELLKHNSNIAVIVSDFSMPYMNGIEFFEHANSLAPNTIRILVTGYADINIAMDAINKGHIFRFITKPFEIDHLTKAIKDALYQHKISTIEKNDLLKNEFLNIISHEVRTPLGGITSFLEIIKEELEAGTLKKLKPYFDVIDENTKRLLRTIHLMIDISEVISNTFELKFKSINLVEEIINPIVVKYAIKAEARRITVDLNMDREEYKIYYDKYCIEQILSNIIDNAITYNYNGLVSITLSHSNSKLIVEIADDGIGMSDEFQKTMFDPFVQAEQGPSRSYEGNGLGLTLVREFCKILNIKFEVKSSLKEGTVFILYLTLED